jgi:type III pantothenate kinase
MTKLLAIDIGNTQTTIGLFDGNTLTDTWRLSTRVARTADELWIVLSHLLELDRGGSAAAFSVSISSVVPELTQVYSLMVKARLHTEPFIITSDTVRSLKNAYVPPEAVGADRLCGAVAAYKQWGGPLILVDMGTATVFDVISEDGVYLGGLIAPGLLTAAESLHRTAALLPVVDLKFPQSVIGGSTEAAMQAGIVYGALDMIDGVVERIQKELSKPAQVVATGGFALLLQPQSRTIQRVEPDLVLHGIRYITEEQ